MTISALTSSPLSPLAGRARELSAVCDELWVASAFVSSAALDDVVATAARHCATVKFLTGTFGNVTRQRTFEHIYRLAASTNVEARVWEGDFHTKLYLWRQAKRGICWVGSANLTDRGLQEPGELIAEIADPWTSTSIRRFRRAFDAKWARANPIDRPFLDRYREAPRPPSALLGQGRARKRAVVRARPARTMIVLPVARHYADGGGAAARIEAKLGGTARSWYRSGASQLRDVRPGCACLVVDGVDGTIKAAVATERARDGKGNIVAYDDLSRKADRKLTKSLKSQLTNLGLRPTSTAFRTQWLPIDTATATVELLYGANVRRRFEQSLRSHHAYG